MGGGIPDRKDFYQIRRISRKRKFLNLPTCNSLVCALVSPHLDYAKPLYYGLPAHLLDRLQRVQNAAARLVTGANRFASSKALLKSLHWLPVRARNQYKIAVLVYRCINGCAPSYLCELVTRYVPARALCSSHFNDLRVPKIKCNRYGRRSFMSAAPSVWNPLPLSLKVSPNLNTFCTELKTHLFRLYNQRGGRNSTSGCTRFRIKAWFLPILASSSAWFFHDFGWFSPQLCWFWRVLFDFPLIVILLILCDLKRFKRFFFNKSVMILDSFAVILRDSWQGVRRFHSVATPSVKLSNLFFFLTLDTPLIDRKPFVVR